MNNRPIKFRAWDKKEKVMLIPPAIDNPEREDDEWVLMQFTGLLDKNGKEIWEGDIVKAEPKEWVPVVGTVEYIGAYYVVRAKTINHPIMNGMKSIIEVIGNIYENPELLK